jgi:hypothetical protein
MQHAFTGVFPRKEGGIWVLAGSATPSQTVESLLRTPWLTTSAKSSLPNSLQMNLYGSTNRILPSQKGCS